MSENPARTGDVHEQPPSSRIDSTVPHTARIWNYWLGGKDNYAVDRTVGDEVRAAFPGMVDNARAARGLLERGVGYLAGRAGIRQFLDIGTGLPTANNTHEVAQSLAPESRVVYVDNDPLVLVHARALLTSDPLGVTDYIDADLRDQDGILAEAARTLDFTKPVALILMGILGHIADYDQARSIVAGYLAQLCPGSYLLTGDATNTSPGMIETVRIWNEAGGEPHYHLRSPAQITGYFDGLELVEPGVVSASQWRPDPNPSGTPQAVDGYGGLGRKP